MHESTPRIFLTCSTGAMQLSQLTGTDDELALLGLFLWSRRTEVKFCVDPVWIQSPKMTQDQSCLIQRSRHKRAWSDLCACYVHCLSLSAVDVCMEGVNTAYRPEKHTTQNRNQPFKSTQHKIYSSTIRLSSCLEGPNEYIHPHQRPCSRDEQRGANQQHHLGRSRPPGSVLRRTRWGDQPRAVGYRCNIGRRSNKRRFSQCC